MAEKELQVKPLTESSSLSNSNHFWSDENPEPPIPQNDAFKFWRRTKVFQCCGCVIAILLIIVVTFLIFSFTVYNLKEPQLSLNAVTLFNSNNDSNMTLTAHVYVKNSNVFTLRFGSTTMLFYNETVIGEGRIPSGKAKAQRTLLLNVTVEIVRDKFMIMAHQHYTQSYQYQLLYHREWEGQSVESVW